MDLSTKIAAESERQMADGDKKAKKKIKVVKPKVVIDEGPEGKKKKKKQKRLIMNVS